MINILIWLPLTTISGGRVISITDEFHHVHVFADSEGFKLGYHWCLWIKLNNDLIQEQKMKRQNSNLLFFNAALNRKHKAQSECKCCCLPSEK